MQPAWLRRRDVLRGMAALPLAKLAACGDDGGGMLVPDGPGSADAPTADAPPSDWASGGTDAMTDKATYPDPFTAPLTTCVLVAAATEGPCNTPSDLVREDVSEGWDGLPVRLALKVVNSACEPVANASVKIWHTNREGIYSGMTPNPAFCTESRADYIAMDFMRGVQVTNADGVVYFDTCYPGWYPGRAIHIHFQVKNGGTTYRISQLFFPEALTTSIFASHVDYREFGQPDTTFANDGVIAPITGAARDRLICDVARMTDGAMLASKVVAIM